MIQLNQSAIHIIRTSQPSDPTNDPTQPVTHPNQLFFYLLIMCLSFTLILYSHSDSVGLNPTQSATMITTPSNAPVTQFKPPTHHHKPLQLKINITTNIKSIIYNDPTPKTLSIIDEMSGDVSQGYTKIIRKLVRKIRSLQQNENGNENLQHLSNKISNTYRTKSPTNYPTSHPTHNKISNNISNIAFNTSNKRHIASFNNPSTTSQLFHPKQLISSKEDVANNYTHGHYTTTSSKTDDGFVMEFKMVDDRDSKEQTQIIFDDGKIHFDYQKKIIVILLEK